ncbi:recombination protein NinB [Sphingomonas beigongshangi]|uniref:recombination protein NinB n=1 Tax=Sphingomonas beigongshangi TaxID=2782540 RepID=UPI00193B425C
MSLRYPAVKLRGPSQRAYAKQLIDQAPDGYVVRIAAETRRDAQNRKLWPMLSDLQRQVPAMATYSTEDIKLRFLNALGSEMRFLPALEGEGMFPVGLRSSTLTVQQFSALVELIYAFGAKHDVRWSEPHPLKEVA